MIRPWPVLKLWRSPPAADAHLAVQRVMDLMGAVVGIQSEGQGYFACWLVDAVREQCLDPVAHAVLHVRASAGYGGEGRWVC